MEMTRFFKKYLDYIIFIFSILILIVFILFTFLNNNIGNPLCNNIGINSGCYGEENVCFPDNSSKVLTPCNAKNNPCHCIKKDITYNFNLIMLNDLIISESNQCIIQASFGKDICPCLLDTLYLMHRAGWHNDNLFSSIYDMREEIYLINCGKFND